MEKIHKNLNIFLLILFLLGINICSAQEHENTDLSDQFLSRGRAVFLVTNEFELATKNAEFLERCDSNIGECLFDFFSRTNFDEYRANPLILYPDVFPAYQYYQSINLATKLAIVRGYYEEGNSPFKPENKISRIEAIKLILSASGQMNWLDRFEFSLPGAEILNNLDFEWIMKVTGIDNVDSLTWWHGRYLIKAREIGIIGVDSKIDVNEDLKEMEFLNMIETLKKYLHEISQEKQSGNFEGQTVY